MDMGDVSRVYVLLLRMRFLDGWAYLGIAAGVAGGQDGCSFV